MSPEGSLEDTLWGLSVHSYSGRALGGTGLLCSRGRRETLVSISGQNAESWDQVTQVLQFMRAKLLKTVEWEGIT